MIEAHTYSQICPVLAERSGVQRVVVAEPVDRVVAVGPCVLARLLNNPQVHGWLCALRRDLPAKQAGVAIGKDDAQPPKSDKPFRWDSSAGTRVR